MKPFDRVLEVQAWHGRPRIDPLADEGISLRDPQGPGESVGGCRWLAGPDRAGHAVARGRRGPVWRVVALLLSLLPGAVPVAAPLLEAFEPARARALVSDLHPLERCPHAHHPHYLCLQVQQFLPWPAAGSGILPAVLFGAQEAGFSAPDPATAERRMAVAARAPPLA